MDLEGAREQSVDGNLVLVADVDLSIGNRRNRELHCIASGVAVVRVERTIPQLVCYVRGVERVQHGGAGRGVVSRINRPHNAVGIAIRRNGWRGARESK